MRPATPKRAAQNRRYLKLRAEYLASQPVCQYPECGAPALEVHHKRGRVGLLLLAVEHWVGLCHGCHVRVTEHPAEAYALGLSERRVGVA